MTADPTPTDPVPSEPQPLTDEEIELLRKYVGSIKTTLNADLMEMAYKRWLATIDAKYAEIALLTDALVKAWAALAAAEEKVAALEAERDTLQALIDAHDLHVEKFAAIEPYLATTESKLSIAVAALERIVMAQTSSKLRGSALTAREALERIKEES